MSEARLPRLFGKYTLLRPLARGGMGELYLAALGELGGAEKLCVIKKLPEPETRPRPPAPDRPAAASGPRPEAHKRRLLDEARVMARLNHVNLVQVFDAGMVDGELYLAMELVAGRDLRAAWNRCADLQARIPVELALYVVREVARGLAYAHSYGGLALVHRDVAPPNILLSWQGEVKITDFGLAASRLKSERTGPGIVFGRIGYLAPEQARGEQADKRTDIYALGVVLWELFTGRPLVDPLLDAAEMLRTIRTARPDPPTRYSPDLPESLSAVVMRALAPQREERYATADELRLALSRELVRLAPEADGGTVVSFLRTLYGDEIEAEQAEHERLLREELPRVRAASGLPSPPRLSAPVGPPALDAGTVSGALEGPPAPRPRPEDARSEAERRLGQLIEGRYRLDRLLGVGGMGAVFEAEHVAIRKRVAVKVLHRAFSQQADLVMRFRREAQAASRIGHPNIVGISDFGYTSDGCAYLVMEHLSGVDLGRVLEQGGRVPWERALPIAAQLVQALGAAHAVGIIHRDLKPENIFLVDPISAEDPDRGDEKRPRDVVKVLDFGIAMRLEPSVPIRLTLPGLTVGTPEYMAPEQGTGDLVDARVDVYAVGTILFEMLLGRLPFVDPTVPELFTRKVNEEAPAPRSLDPSMHLGLSRLIARCLSRSPAARPQTMAELARALKEVYDDLRMVVRIGPERVSGPAASDPTLHVALAPVPEKDKDRGAEPPTPAAPPAPTVERAASGLSPLPEDRPSHSVLEIVYEAGVPAGPAGAGAPQSVDSIDPSAPVELGSDRPPPEPERLPQFVDLDADSARSWYQSYREAVPRWQLWIVTGSLLILLLAISVALTRWRLASPKVAIPEVRAPEEPPRAAPRPDPGEKALGAEVALLEWARRAADNGRYTSPPGDNLVELLQRIEAVAPRHPEAARLRASAAAKAKERGQAALRRRELDEALQAYEVLKALQAEESFPRSDLAHELLQQARASNSRRGRQRALESARRAVSVTPDSVPALLVLGEVHLAAGQKAEAAAAFRRALALHPYPQEERAAQQGLNKATGSRRRRR